MKKKTKRKEDEKRKEANNLNFKKSDPKAH